jgi:FixJ family two-component response regulator
MGPWRCTGGILDANQHIRDGFSALSGVYGRIREMAIGGMMKKVLVSVVDDDRFFRESMCRLIRSLGHAADTFSSAVEFLASPRLTETACLIADIHMPAMTGLELIRRLIDTGHAIPTILVTAFPNDADRARAESDGVLCYLRKPVDEEQLTRYVGEALSSGGSES